MDEPNRPLSRSHSIMLLAFLCLFNACIPIKAVFLGAPDKKDILRFRSSKIEAGDDCFQFENDVSGIGPKIRVNEWSSGSPDFVSLDELNRHRPVRSFLVIRNDTLLYSFYGQGTTEMDVNASYSVAKSFTSALIGIAIQDGFIDSERDLVIDHVPELKDIPGAEDLRIEHLLNMTSGMKYRLKTDAVLYYGNDVKKALKHIEFECTPGTKQQYLNINVQLLGIILHRATGKKPSEYLSEKIWKPLGMCSNAIWTTDKKGEDLTFCCMGATALDYAKFGRLYLNQGNWNGSQIVPESWIERSIRTTRIIS